jgi:N-acyl-phosphatidylethanolamine-hydrolysing phospholipase D
MANYTSTITKVADLAPVPEEAVAKPHHVTKRGRVVGFKNLYESWAGGVSFPRIIRYVMW